MECNRQNALITSLAQVMPDDRHDNVLITDRIEVRDPLLGNGAQHIYRARSRRRAPSGVVLEATAPDGYGGAIDLIVGVDTDGRAGRAGGAPAQRNPGLATK